MSFSPIVPLVLLVCWVLPALLIGGLYRLRRSNGTDRVELDTMDISFQEIRAEVLDLDYEAQAPSWKDEDWEGPDARVRARMTNTSHEVVASVPYAEATVTVTTGKNETQTRGCSLCLN